MLGVIPDANRDFLKQLQRQISNETFSLSKETQDRVKLGTHYIFYLFSYLF